MACLVCNEPRETIGVACAECLEELALTIALVPEQIRVQGKTPTAAALVDPWGRLHRLHKKTAVGRELDDDGLLILDATISRRHAQLEHKGDAWTIVDLGSSNGTHIEDVAVTAEPRPLRDGERVRFGSVSLFFLDDVGATPQVDPASLDGFTVRGPPQASSREIERVKVKDITVTFEEPTGGGGGVVIFSGKAVQCTLPQFEFVRMLYDRAQTSTEPEEVRGFVHPTELARTLSLESAVPSEDHVRQLVRRLRRVFFKAGLPNVIESRYGAGYRLRLRTM